MVQALLHAGDERGPYLEPQIDVGGALSIRWLPPFTRECCGLGRRV